MAVGARNSDTFQVTTPSDREIRDMVLQTGMARGAGISYDRLEDVAAGLGKNG